jgi:PTS system ascorbate-specific IIA component
MVGILIVAHGSFGDSLIHSCSHVLGKCPSRLAQLSVAVNDDPDLILPQARSLVAQVDEGDGVLVLTDMLGGTPSNIATRLLAQGRVEGVAGVSLPMLIRALTYRDEPLQTVTEKALSGGSEGVVRINGHAANGS